MVDVVDGMAGRRSALPLPLQSVESNLIIRAGTSGGGVGGVRGLGRAGNL